VAGLFLCLEGMDNDAHVSDVLIMPHEADTFSDISSGTGLKSKLRSSMSNNGNSPMYLN
jgi:hypothetical protein